MLYLPPQHECLGPARDPLRLGVQGAPGCPSCPNPGGVLLGACPPSHPAGSGSDGERGTMENVTAGRGTAGTQQRRVARTAADGPRAGAGVSSQHPPPATLTPGSSSSYLSSAKKLRGGGGTPAVSPALPGRTGLRPGSGSPRGSGTPALALRSSPAPRRVDFSGSPGFGTWGDGQAKSWCLSSGVLAPPAALPAVGRGTGPTQPPRSHAESPGAGGGWQDSGA